MNHTKTGNTPKLIKGDMNMKTFMTQFVINGEVKAMKFEEATKSSALDYVVACFPSVNRNMILIHQF